MNVGNCKGRMYVCIINKCCEIGKSIFSKDIFIFTIRFRLTE